MWVIGVTGGIASGKSRVAQELGRRGAAVLDADRIGHAVLEEPRVKSALQARWGEDVIRREGGEGPERVDRAAIAERVFSPPPEGSRELAYLESLIHPLIHARIAAVLDHWRAEGRIPAAVLDAPVLHKAGWGALCDRVVHVEAPLEARVGRVVSRGWSRDQLLARERTQPSLAEQRQWADFVIDNGGSFAHTRQQIDEFWDALWAEGHKKGADQRFFE